MVESTSCSSREHPYPVASQPPITVIPGNAQAHTCTHIEMNHKTKPGPEDKLHDQVLLQCGSDGKVIEGRVGVVSSQMPPHPELLLPEMA